MGLQVLLKLILRRVFFTFFAGCILTALCIFSLLSLGSLASDQLASLPNGNLLQVAILSGTLFLSLVLLVALFRERRERSSVELRPILAQDPWKFVVAKVAVPLSVGFLAGFNGGELRAIEIAKKNEEKKSVFRLFSSRILGLANRQRITLPVTRSGSNENRWDSIPRKMRW